MPDNPYQLAQQFRAALLQRDADALREITAAYDQLVTSLQLSVSALAAQAQRARATGQTVNATWLFRERRLNLLLTQAEQQLATFTAQATRQITNDQRAAVTLAQDHAKQLLSAADAEITFTRLPTAAIETLVGFSGDGAPLHKLLAKLPGDGATRIKETLIAAIATGQSPRQTATQINDALAGNKARALTIARTETLRAYREASRQTAKAAGVTRYEWISSKSQRTCLACLALDGQIFAIEKPQPSHPNCRCSVLYLPPGYVPPPRETGAPWFAQQPDEVQAKMMSKVALEAYSRGAVKLQDFVGVKRSRVWGEMRYERSFKDALKVAQKQGTTAALMQEKKLLKLMRAKEDQIRAQRFESAFFWDGRGNLLLSKDGDVSRVTFNDQELALMKGAVATHNHPHGWRYSERDGRRGGHSFSAKDVRLACQASLTILRLVTPKFRYMMKPPPQGWDQNYWETTLLPAYSQMFEEVKREFRAQVQARQILQSEAEPLLRHEVWDRLARQFGLQYSREEF